MARTAPAHDDLKPSPTCGESSQPSVVVPRAMDASNGAFPKWSVESDLGAVPPTDAEIEAIIRLLGEGLDAFFS